MHINMSVTRVSTFSWPAVSHIWKSTELSPTLTVLVVNAALCIYIGCTIDKHVIRYATMSGY